MENFIIVLFKNKKKKKIIKGYLTDKNANLKYDKLLKENSVIFDVQIENSRPSHYEIALLSKEYAYQIPLFKTDEIGRNINIFLDDGDGYTIKRIDDYKIEELIYDYQTKQRITFNEFLKLYCPKNQLKIISTLHNKLIVQIDETFNLFVLKNTKDSERLLRTLESFFIENGRSDSLFVKDISVTHRKWMYNILEEKGFNRKFLYRQVINSSKQT